MTKQELKKKIVLAIIALVLILIFWGSSEIQGEYNKLIDFFTSIVDNQPFVSIAVFLFLTVVSVMFLFFSSILVVPVAVSVWGSLNTTFLLLLGWIIGSVFSYLIGRYAGHPVLRYFVAEEKLKQVEDFFSEDSGPLSAFLLRFTLPSEIPGYALGIFRFNFLKYLFITTIAEIPYAFVTVYSFDAVLRKDPIVLSAIVLVWLVAAGILAKILYNRRKLKNKNSE